MHDNDHTASQRSSPHGANATESESLRLLSEGLIYDGQAMTSSLEVANHVPRKSKGERKIVEQQLRSQAMRSSEERLRANFDLSPECLKLLAADRTLLEMNPAGLAMIEADTFEQVANQSIIPFVVPEHRPAFENFMRRVSDGESGTLEFEVIGLKGRRLWLEMHASPLHCEAGQVSDLLAITRNITERKQAETQLRFSQERFAAVFRASPVGICLTTLKEGTFLEVNDAFLRIVGHGRNDLIGSSSLDLNYWIDPDERRVMVQTLIVTGSVTDREIKFRRRDGSIGDSLRSLQRINFDGQDCILTLLHDITVRKQAERAVQESDERRRAILDGMFAFVGLLSLDGTLLEVNRAPLEAAGLSHEDVIGMCCTDTAWFKNLPTAQADLRHAI